MKFLKFKWVFIFFLLFGLSPSKAQLSDIIGVLGKMGEKSKEILELQKIKNILDQTQDTIKSSKEYLNKINSILKRFNYVKKIKTLVENIIKEAQSAKTFIEKNKAWLSSDVIEDLNLRLDTLLDSIESIKNIVLLVLESDIFRMDDFQRMKTIEENLANIETKYNRLKEKKESLREIVEFEKIITNLKTVVQPNSSLSPYSMNGDNDRPTEKMPILEKIQEYLKSKTYENALNFSKFVAVIFILTQLIMKYFNQRIDQHKETIAFSPSDLTRPALYIFLICFFTTILGYLEDLAHSFFKPSYEMTTTFIDFFEGGKKFFSDKIKADSSTAYSGGWFMKALLSAFNLAVSFFIGVADMGYYLGFFIERTFLLGIGNLLFPFLLAFSCLDLFKDLIVKGLKMYLATVLLLYVLHLSFGAGNIVYEFIFQPFKNLSMKNDLEHFQNGAAMVLGKSIAGFIAIIIKLRLAKRGSTYLYRIMY